MSESFRERCNDLVFANVLWQNPRDHGSVEYDICNTTAQDPTGYDSALARANRGYLEDIHGDILSGGPGSDLSFTLSDIESADDAESFGYLIDDLERMTDYPVLDDDRYNYEDERFKRDDLFCGYLWDYDIADAISARFGDDSDSPDDAFCDYCDGLDADEAWNILCSYLYNGDDNDKPIFVGCDSHPLYASMIDRLSLFDYSDPSAFTYSDAIVALTVSALRDAYRHNDN